MSVRYLTDLARERFLCVCLGKMKSDACPNQLITFTRCLYETLTINYRHLPSTVLNHTCAFQLLDGLRDGWPVDTQHFGEQALSDRECVIVTAVAHHEQPTR
jgi:hypothetical protein